jgi:hypothetical protein
MIILLTENSPIGMLALASVDSITVDFYPLGTYEDSLYEIKAFLHLCKQQQRPTPSLFTTQSLPAHLSVSGTEPTFVRSKRINGKRGRDRFPTWHKKRWVTICNNTPWSDMILSDPVLVANPTSVPHHQRQKDIYDIKKQIYEQCGWAPDAIINIYDNAPTEKWRAKVKLLRKNDQDITIISLNANDPKFTKDIVDAVHMLVDTHLSDTDSLTPEIDSPDSCLEPYFGLDLGSEGSLRD